MFHHHTCLRASCLFVLLKLWSHWPSLDYVISYVFSLVWHYWFIWNRTLLFSMMMLTSTRLRASCLFVLLKLWSHWPSLDYVISCVRLTGLALLIHLRHRSRSAFSDFMAVCAANLDVQAHQQTTVTWKFTHWWLLEFPAQHAPNNRQTHCSQAVGCSL